MPVFANLNCFNAGELSPRMQGRNDVSQYSKGCRTLRNFIVTPYGAVERRPGLEFLGRAKYSTGGIRLIRFAFSSTVSYVCEFGNQYLRFWKNGSPVMNGQNPLELATAYTASELPDIKVVQSADVMTVVHPNHPVMELKRTGESAFTFTEKTFEFPPVLDPNLDDACTITPSAVSGTGITLTASKDVFTSGNVGGYFELVHTRQSNEISRDFTADGNSGSLEVYGYWTFTTHGTWTGTLTIQRSFDGGASWTDYRTYSSANDSNTSTSGEEEERNVLYRLTMENYQQASSGTLKKCRCLLVNPDFVTTGVVKITAVTNARTATARVVKKLGGNTATHEWNEGAWSSRRGYPRSVAYFEERMVFGGTSNNPNRVWGSKTGDWDNYLIGTRDDDALDFTLASDTVNTILWMCQHDALIIGTMDSEWTLSASDSNTALTPSNFRIKRQSVYGSSGTQGCMVGDTVLFVQRGGHKVREFVYSWEKDGYSCPDMTILADHIASVGIVDASLQQLPDTIYWCVLADGTLAALTYERDQEVIGWHRHDTQGSVLSVCVIPNGDADEVYFAVERTNGVMIERMAPRRFAEITDAFFVDCGVRRTGSGITVVDNLGHLEGQLVRILGDGAEQTEKTVTNGQIDLDEPADVCVVGLPYSSILSPMPIEIEMQNGQSVLRRKIVAELQIRVYDSVGGEACCNSGSWQQIVSRDILEDRMDTAIVPKDDVCILTPLGGYEKVTVINVRQTSPLPFNVSTIVASYEVAE